MPWRAPHGCRRRLAGRRLSPRRRRADVQEPRPVTEGVVPIGPGPRAPPELGAVAGDAREARGRRLDALPLGAVEVGGVEAGAVEADVVPDGLAQLGAAEVGAGEVERLVFADAGEAP